MHARRLAVLGLILSLLFLREARLRGDDTEKAAEFQSLVDKSKGMIRAYLDAVDCAEFDLEARAKTLGAEVDATFAFVLDRIAYEAYPGALRGAAGCLQASTGNAYD